jgi:hypothetical protein
VLIEKKRNHGLIKHNKINTNNKLKVIKKSLDKHGNTKQYLTPTSKKKKSLFLNNHNIHDIQLV